MVKLPGFNLGTCFDLCRFGRLDIFPWRDQTMTIDFSAT
ncbi:MAG: hypothetical protein JWP23_3607, partial [Phenylobacterium sp.]|nr:hypothetical protein [Phenylobacterium sp.]